MLSKLNSINSPHPVGQQCCAYFRPALKLLRRSLHGLDYIAADCGKAFDELIAMLPKVSSDCTWVERWQRALMEAKQYIKSDYKAT